MPFQITIQIWRVSVLGSYLQIFCVDDINDGMQIYTRQFRCSDSSSYHHFEFGIFSKGGLALKNHFNIWQFHLCCLLVSVYWQGKYLASNSAPGLWAVDRRTGDTVMNSELWSPVPAAVSHLTYWAHVALGDLKWSFNDSDQSVAKHFYQLSMQMFWLRKLLSNYCSLGVVFQSSIDR